MGLLAWTKCHRQRYLTILFLCSNCTIHNCEYYENGMCELQSNLCSKEHYVSSNEIITLLLVRCFLQAFCINFTALICWKKSSDYILMKFYCESISLIRSCSRKNLIFLDQIIAKIAEKVK